MRKLLLTIIMQMFAIEALCAAQQEKSAELKSKRAAPKPEQPKKPTAFNTLVLIGVEKEGTLTRYIIQNIYTGNITVISLPTFADSKEKPAINQDK